MSKYSIDFLKLSAEILPPRKRGEKRVRFVYRLAAWVRKIHSEFIALEADLAYQAKVTNHVIVFQQHLINSFGAGIEIVVNEVSSNEAFVPHQADNDLGMFVIGHQDDEDGGAYISNGDTLELYNFTVNVPAVLSADLDRMRAIIDRYKVPGSTYNIIEA